MATEIRESQSMKFFDFFTSRYTRRLEKENEELIQQSQRDRETHRLMMETMKKEIEDVRFARAADLVAEEQRHRELATELKKSHAAELLRAINETQRARDEVDRLRVFLLPGIKSEKPEPESSGPPPPPVGFTGTPWQRVMAREMEKQDKEWNARHSQPTAAPDPAPEVKH